MKKFISSRTIYILLRIVLGGLFVYAGVTKLMDVMGFAATIDQYGIVSWRTAKLIAQYLPIIEIAAGIGVIFDLFGALGVLVAQLLGFVFVLGYGIHLGLNVDCGCFGPADPAAGQSNSLWGTLIRDIFMLGACALLYAQRAIAGFQPRPAIKFIRKN